VAAFYIRIESNQLLRSNFMENTKILKRAWTILWNYRSLWLFGLILGLTMGGSFNYSFNNNNSQQNLPDQVQGSLPYPFDQQSLSSPTAFLDALQRVSNQAFETFIPTHEVGALIGFLGGFLLLCILIWLGMTFLRYISETAVLRMVDRFEASDEKVSIREGFRLGRSTAAWRIFLMDLLTGALPGLLLLVLLGLIGWRVFSLLIVQGGFNGSLIELVILAALAFILVLAFSVYGILLGLVRNFIIRSLALEQKGLMEALRGGLGMVWSNWRKVGIFWLILIGLGVAWAFISILLLIPLIPILLVTVIMGALLACLPGLLFGFLSSFFVSSYWPIVVGVIFGLPFFITLAGAPLFFIQGMAQLYRSICWTLTYRELKTIENNPGQIELINPQ
jgi:hypothetical protein